MAWPFGTSSGSIEDDADLSEERLRIMANIAIEQVPMPEEGDLSEDDAWTISPGPTRAKLNSGGQLPSAVQAAAATQVQANLDTSGLERLLSTRLDTIEDVLRQVEVRSGDAQEAGMVSGVIEKEKPKPARI